MKIYQAQLSGFGWQESARVPCIGGDHDLLCAGHSWFQLELTLMQAAHRVPKLLQLGEPTAPLLRQWWESCSCCARINGGDAEKTQRETWGETEEQEDMWWKHEGNAKRHVWRHSVESPMGRETHGERYCWEHGWRLLEGDALYWRRCIYEGLPPWRTQVEAGTPLRDCSLWTTCATVEGNEKDPRNSRGKCTGSQEWQKESSMHWHKPPALLSPCWRNWLGWV